MPSGLVETSRLWSDSEHGLRVLPLTIKGTAHGDREAASRYSGTALGLHGRRTLTVVAEGSVTLRYGGLYAFFHGQLDESFPLRDVSHVPVKDRSQQLGCLKAHVVVSLIDNELHGHQLGSRALGYPLCPILCLLLKLLHGNGSVDEAHLRRRTSRGRGR